MTLPSALHALRLRLGHPLSSLQPSLHNGPGWRVSLWTQGCSLRCTRNCLNPTFLGTTGGWSFAPDDIMRAIRQCQEGCPELEGITVLGGEPTDQLEAVTVLLELARAEGLSTMVYSGLTLEALRRKFPVEEARFHKACDLLVDGPFMDALREENLAWRGSSNQRILCLTHRYAPHGLEEAFRRQGKGFSIHVSAGGSISVSGLQERTAAAAVEEILQPAL